MTDNFVDFLNFLDKKFGDTTLFQFHLTSSKTYHEFVTDVFKACDYLIQKGIKPHDKIILAIVTNYDEIKIMIALICIGAIVIPIGSPCKTDFLNFAFDQYNPKYLIATSDFLKSIDTNRKYNVLYVKDVHSNKAASLFETNPLDDCTIFQTSGTTGEIKSFAMTQKGLLSGVDRFNYINLDTYKNKLMSHFLFCPMWVPNIFYEFVIGLYVGRTFKLFDRKSKLNFIEQLDYYRPDFLFLLKGVYIDFFIKRLKAGQKINVLKIGFGGDKLSPDQINLFLSNNIEVFHGYVASEIGLVAVNNYRLGGIVANAAQTNCFAELWLDKTELKIINNEIFIKRKHMIHRYFNNDLLNKERFIDG
jgi:long-subunit acyl-CoA synthetase (AMP-forming)